MKIETYRFGVNPLKIARYTYKIKLHHIKLKWVVLRSKLNKINIIIIRIKLSVKWVRPWLYGRKVFEKGEADGKVERPLSVMTFLPWLLTWLLAYYFQRPIETHQSSRVRKVPLKSAKHDYCAKFYFFATILAH